MSYGVCSTDTRAWIERRADQSGLTMTQIDIESESEYSLLLSIIFEGALDEEFNVGSDYASTVADWVVELLRDQYPTKEWEVMLNTDNPYGSEQLYYCSNFQE